MFCCVVLLSSFGVTFFTIPSIIHVAKFRNFYDDPGHQRKKHQNSIPRLGGIAIFISFMITILLFDIRDQCLPINYLLTACMMIFAMGLKDDLLGVNPATKFFIQFLAAATIVVLGEVRFSSMYGLFGVYDIHYAFSIMLSVLTIMFLINAFNLVDGIDGLAGITGIVVHLAFAALFLYTHQYSLALVSLTITGAISGFIRFNLSPARIFMGDTGSLMIGLISAVMAITFVESNKFISSEESDISSAPAIAIAILIGPIADTMRVFVLRILKGHSPFKADRNHIHHRLLDLGLTHLQTTLLLVMANLLIIVLAFLLSHLGNAIFMALITVLLFLLNWLLGMLLRYKKQHHAMSTRLYADKTSSPLHH